MNSLFFLSYMSMVLKSLKLCDTVDITWIFFIQTKKKQSNIRFICESLLMRLTYNDKVLIFGIFLAVVQFCLQ